MILIGLHGPMQAGKDTASSFIHEWANERGVRASSRAFADTLKLSAARLFFPEISREDAVAWCDRMKFRGHIEVETLLSEDPGPLRTVRENIIVSGRTFLQRYGTEAHRNVFDSDFWVDALLPVNGQTAGPPGVTKLVHDVRGLDYVIGFWWRSFDWKDICLITDCRFENEAERIRDLGGQVWRIDRSSLEQTDTHASEVPLPSRLVDLTIDNNGTLDDYRETIRTACEERLVPALTRPDGQIS